jgi:hypothetical protein
VKLIESELIKVRVPPIGRYKRLSTPSS